jgi:hypothetical protein
MTEVEVYQLTRNWTLATPLAIVWFVSFFGFLGHSFFSVWHYVEASILIIFGIINAILATRLFGNHQDDLFVWYWVGLDMILLVNGLSLILAKVFSLKYFERLMDFNWCLFGMINVMLFHAITDSTTLLRTFAAIFFFAAATLSPVANRYSSPSNTLSQKIAVAFIYVFFVVGILLVGAVPTSTVGAIVYFGPIPWGTTIIIVIWAFLAADFLTIVVVGFYLLANPSKAASIELKEGSSTHFRDSSTSHPSEWTKLL